jgi:hypothetical protein
MAWIQWTLAVVIVVASLEITYRRLKSLLEIRGHLEDAHDALVGRVNSIDGSVKKVEQRVEILEHELKLR